jgi:hypothetical protein
MSTKKATPAPTPVAPQPDPAADARRAMITMFVAELMARTEAVRPHWEAKAAAMAKPVAEKKSKVDTENTRRADAIAKAIKRGEFGCRAESVAALLGVVTGLPVASAYKAINSEQKNAENDKSAVPRTNLRTGVCITSKSGTVFMNAGSGGFCPAGSGSWVYADDCYTLNRSRLSTEAEIREYVTKRFAYFMDNAKAFMPKTLK